MALKDWSHNTFGTLDLEIEFLKKEASKWEIRAENNTLSEVERDQWLNIRKEWLEKEKENPNSEGSDLLPKQLTEMQAAYIEDKFTEKEVFDAINKSGSSKAPGPDGFKFKFFKLYWDLVKNDLMSALNWFWESSKVLSIRIRKVIPDLIGDEQSAFIKGSLIWDFLLEIMKRMGFGCKWRKWILACLKSASISILVKGSPTNEFTIERGVRQGDPLSPFLFIIAVEGLNYLTKRAIASGLYKGVEIGANKVNISHLQYADDTIFLGDWSRQNFCNLMNVIKRLESIRRNFFWGGSGDFSKLTRVKWEDSLLPYEEGGLNVGSLLVKNLALLGKWPRGRSSIWLNILRAGHYIESLGFNFAHSITKQIGDRRLSYFEAVQGVLVKDRVNWSVQPPTLSWNWNRLLTTRAGADLEELTNMLNAFVKPDRIRDSWSWNLASNGNFTTKKLSSLIEDKITGDISRPHEETLKNYLVPNEVELFIWRVLKRRIPVRTELDKRCIDLDSVRCPVCDENVETIEHSMIFCRHSMDVWDRVYKWWGLGTVSNLSLNEAFWGRCSQVLSHSGSLFWQAIEWTYRMVVLALGSVFLSGLTPGSSSARWLLPLQLSIDEAVLLYRRPVCF
ncbi:uncharacterized protein [Rutidosis leptorrhynchoides]|uniref:uncharacterized protein n=1 Tax=Rutidosis leptorrhynchoides TaxID=125765 RepID=UPI003A997DC2